MTDVHRIVTNRLAGREGRPSHRYEILNEIGAGGMATVYRARQLETGRLVAIKFPHADKIEAHDDLYERFCREAEMMKLVRHKNVIRILDFGLDEGYQPYMVMELIEGAKTLADVILEYYDRFYSGKSGPTRIRRSLIPMDEAIGYFREILAGLGAIHAAGIIHRDLKPENILVTVVDGERLLKVMDLGIAKNLKSKPDDAKLTQNMVVGTPYYLSPEHIWPQRNPETGDDVGIGTYSDIWSALVILYQMISGQLPFMHDALEILTRQIMNDPPKPITDYVDDVNPAILNLFQIGFNKKPWERPQDVEAVLEYLDAVDAVERVSNMDVRPPPMLRTSRRPTMVSAPQIPDPRAAKSRVPLVAILFFGVVALGAGGWVVLSRPHPSAVLLGPVPPGADSVTAVEPSSQPSSVPVPTKASVPSARPARGKAAGPEPSASDGAAYRAYQNGVRAMARGDCRSAEMDMNLVLIHSPDFPTPYRILGDCARKRGRTADARSFYAQYLAYDGVEPLSPEAQNLLARTK